jgi:ABC-type dipeptide/oligopeptide/nickel transport system permease component
MMIWLAATVVFVALRVVPGDAILTQLRESGAPISTIDARRAELGLDQSLPMQYLGYLGALARGDLGSSLVTGTPVSALLAEQIDSTIELIFASMSLALPLGIGLGSAACLRGWRGYLAQGLVAFALSAPIYWTGTIALFVFSAGLGLLPSGGASSLSRLILPALVLSFSLAGGIARVTEASLMAGAGSPYVTTAHAKGLRRRYVALRHILYPALPPILTQAGLQIGFLLSGAVVTETIFSRPGLGRLLLDATLRQDYPVVQGVVVWGSTAFAVVTLLVDLLISLIDPRLRSAA